MSVAQRPEYPIKASEFIDVLVKDIIKETSKEFPVIGSIVRINEAVFAKIEKNRVKQVLQEMERRFQGLENNQSKLQELLKKPRAYTTLIYGCDQARSDVLLDSKVKDYGCVIGNLIEIEAELDDVVEILDSLRKLSARDLKTLYQFKSASKIFDGRDVKELVGFQIPTTPPFINADVPAIKKSMRELYPSLMRLEGLGILFLESSPYGSSVPNIGGLTDKLDSFAALTPMGKKLVQALP